MKNILALCMAIAFGSPAFSQSAESTTTPEKDRSFKSIHGHEVLPQKGEWAIGVSATGFLNYLGNMANNSATNNAPTFSSANDVSPFALGQLSGVAISGKYMKTSSLAYRVRFQANDGSVDRRNNVLKNTPTPDPLNPIYTEDKLTTNSYNVLLGAGFEKRRGSGRVQGFYGAEVLLGFAGNSRTYTYGNGFDGNYPAPMSTTDFNNAISAYSSLRTLEDRKAPMLLAGVRSFIGIEYFIAPKISLGGEMGYTLGFSTQSKETIVKEQWNAPANEAATVTTTNYYNNGLRSWGIGLDNINAGINLHFYF